MVWRGGSRSSTAGSEATALGRRLVRKLTTEDKPAAMAALAAARAALRDAEREVARLQHEQATRDLDRARKAVGRRAVEAVQAVREALGDLQTREDEARRLALACGAQPPSPSYPWSMVTADATGPILNLNGLGEYRRGSRPNGSSALSLR